jgi:hypothetical protein
MHPIEEHEVAKVVAAVRQSNTNRLMAVRLLQRINVSLAATLAVIDTLPDDRRLERATTNDAHAWL